MTYYELVFKLQHDCPYNDFSRNYPSAVISHWCNWSRDVLEFAYRDLQEDSSIQKSIQDMTRTIGAKVMRRSFARSNLQIVLQRCACDKISPPTLTVIERRNCLELQPAVYAKGWEWYRVIAFSERDIKSLFKDLEDTCNVTVISRRAIRDESVRDTYLISAASIFGTLTNKQAKALITALDNGYYRMPRGATAGEIAERMGLPRTSFADHLRKGENKVLQAMGVYLRLKPN